MNARQLTERRHFRALLHDVRQHTIPNSVQHIRSTLFLGADVLGSHRARDDECFLCIIARNSLHLLGVPQRVRLEVPLEHARDARDEIDGLASRDATDGVQEVIHIRDHKLSFCNLRVLPAECRQKVLGIALNDLRIHHHGRLGNLAEALLSTAHPVKGTLAERYINPASPWLAIHIPTIPVEINEARRHLHVCHLSEIARFTSQLASEPWLLIVRIELLNHKLTICFQQGNHLIW